jgi:RHS repeat-associated protein
MDWPAQKMHTYLDGQPRPLGDWLGSLVQDQREASGLLFRRNRYYDPATGQFTQQDPIGIAGGMNLYGFANGDPVNFSDPFGLCPVCIVVGAAWAAAEVGLSAADAVAVARTSFDFFRGDASGSEFAGTALAAGVGFVSPGGGGAAGLRVVSRVGESSSLTRLAGRLSGRVQRDVDALTAQLRAGNLNPGSGTRSLFNGIMEARTAGGGRVAFRMVDDQVEILAKFDKKDQSRALATLRREYGGND